MKLEGIYNNGIWLASKMYFLYDGNIRNKKKKISLLNLKVLENLCLKKKSKDNNKMMLLKKNNKKQNNNY